MAPLPVYHVGSERISGHEGKKANKGDKNVVSKPNQHTSKPSHLSNELLF